MVDLDIVIMKDEEVGRYISLVPSLLGCHKQGDTLEEVTENTRETISLYAETLISQNSTNPTNIFEFNSFLG